MLVNKSNYQIGLEAENITEQYLIKLGYEILHTRWKSKFGEIDIIALNQNNLLFVEVKSRKNYLSAPVITAMQQQRNSNAALDFLSKWPHAQNLDIRYDCVIINQGNIVEYIENAWSIEYH